MYKLIVAGLVASLPLTTLAAPAGTTTAATLTTKAPKSCACYTATVTTTPEVCPLCVPLSCSIPTTITTTIPGPNPTCTTTATTTVTRDCVCNGKDGCWTAWDTKTGAFTCKRGGTKETSFPVPLPEPQGEPGVPVSTTETAAGTTDLLPTGTGTGATTDLLPTGTVDLSTETGIMSILPIDLGTPEVSPPTATGTEVLAEPGVPTGGNGGPIMSILPISTATV